MLTAGGKSPASPSRSGKVGRGGFGCTSTAHCQLLGALARLAFRRYQAFGGGGWGGAALFRPPAERPLFYGNKGTLPWRRRRSCTSASIEPLQTNGVKCSFGSRQVSRRYLAARPHLEFLCGAAEKCCNVLPNLSSSVSERLKVLTAAPLV